MADDSGMQAGPAANTSGQGGPVPDEVKNMGWNWGAFWLTWIWGIGNGVWISFVALVLGIIWSVVLGIKGNEWAWQNRRFESIEQFRETQAAWSKWGWIVLVVSAVIWILMMVFGVGAAWLARAGASGAGGLSLPCADVNRPAGSAGREP